MAPAAIMAMPGATVVITTPAMAIVAIVAVVTVPAAVIAAVFPFAVAALLAPARIGTRRPGMPVRRRVAQEVHRAAAGAVAGAVLAPVLGVARGHPHVDRRRGHGGRRNDHGALVQQRWRRRVADVHGAVDARCQLARDRAADVGLRLGRKGRAGQRKDCNELPREGDENHGCFLCYSKGEMLVSTK